MSCNILIEHLEKFVNTSDDDSSGSKQIIITNLCQLRSNINRKTNFWRTKFQMQLKKKLKLQKEMQFAEHVVNDKTEEILKLQKSISGIQQKYQRENEEKSTKIKKLETEILRQQRDAEGMEGSNNRIFGGLCDKFLNELRLKDERISKLSERLRKSLSMSTSKNIPLLFVTLSNLLFFY